MKLKANLNGNAYPHIVIDEPSQIPVFNHESPSKKIGVIYRPTAERAAISIVDKGAESFSEIGRDIPRTITLAGPIEESHLESQRVWLKPWTWLKKPLTVIDKFSVMSAVISRSDIPQKGLTVPNSWLEATKQHFPYLFKLRG